MDSSTQVISFSKETKYGSAENVDVDVGELAVQKKSFLDKFVHYSKKLEGSYGLEHRGIERVSSEDRSPQNWVALCLIWSSAGLTLTAFSAGFSGPASYNLSFAQTTGIIWGAGALGSFCSAFMAIYGKKTGLRALAAARFAFGWYAAMAMAFLNGFTEVSFGILDCILGGTALRVVSREKLPLVVGIVIIGFISWIIATGGYRFIHWYSRFAFILPLVTFIALYAVAGPKFNTSPVPHPDDAFTHNGRVLSYIAVTFGSFAGWVPVSGDFYVYFPESTPDWKIFLLSFLGTWVLPSFAKTCGAGIASIMFVHDDWANIYKTTGSTTAMIEYAFRPLGNVRFFFIFVLAWSMVSNNIMNLYSIGLAVQILGDWALKVPRSVWTLFASILITVLSIVGRHSFSAVLRNLLAVIGYWSITYFGIFALEFRLIRRNRRELNLEAWNNRKLLPPGYAAALAFCFGIAGAVLGMNQTWYSGQIGKLIGKHGGDIGTELALAFSAVVYPAARLLEYHYFKR